MKVNDRVTNLITRETGKINYFSKDLKRISFTTDSNKTFIDDLNHFVLENDYNKLYLKKDLESIEEDKKLIKEFVLNEDIELTPDNLTVLDTTTKKKRKNKKV